jgi:HlyD family secretion protein
MKKAIRIIAIILGVVGALALVVFVVLPRLGQTNTTSTYKTQPAEMGSLVAYVGATGSVRSNQTATLAWETSGTIDQVFVQKGDHVNKDMILANLLGSSVGQNIILAQADLITAKTNLDNLMNNSEARANAQLALAQAQQAVDDAQKSTQSKQYQRASPNTIDIARANLILAQKALDDAETAYSHVSGNTDSVIYATALSNLAKARQDRDRAEYNLRYVEGLPSPLDIQVVSAQLAQAQAKLLSAKNDWEKIKDGPNPDDIKSAQARIDAAQATLDMVRLTAPFDGTVTVVNIKPGDLVNPGSVAFQIDDLTRLLVDVQVSEVDINRVQIGQPVTLTLDALPANEYAGTVTDIASVGNVINGAVNFTVTVELSNPDPTIKPGMTAAVNIAVTQLNDVLLVPNQAVRVVNGNRVVYILLPDGSPQMVNITLGASSNTQSQVLTGNIKSGDEIILNPPANLSAIRGGPATGPGGGGNGP